MNPLPDGKYTVRARTWTFKLSKNENWYLAMTFTIVDPAYEGETVRGFLNFTSEKQSLRSHAVLRHLGWAGQDPAECHDNQGGLDTNTIEVLLGRETYNDQTYSAVSEFFLPNEIDRAALTAFLRRFNVSPPPPPHRNNIE